MGSDIKPFHLVEHFNREIVGIPKRKWPYELDPVEYNWLSTVVHEELNEFLRAHGEDPIGQIDALIDLIYFAMGGLTRLGVTADQAELIFNEVHKKNMLKRAGNKGRGSDLDATKPDSWEGPEDHIKHIMENEK